MNEVALVMITLENAVQLLTPYVKIQDNSVELSHEYSSVKEPRPLTSLILHWKHSGVLLTAGFLDYSRSVSTNRLRSDVFNEIRTVFDLVFEAVAEETGTQRIERLSCTEDVNRNEMSAMYEDAISGSFLMLRLVEIRPGMYIYRTATDLPKKERDRCNYSHLSLEARRRAALEFLFEPSAKTAPSQEEMQSVKMESTPKHSTPPEYVLEDYWA